MAQLESPTGKDENQTLQQFYESSSDEEYDDDPAQIQEYRNNLRLHQQKSWLSKRTSDGTVLSLRSMTDLQRKSFRALFDILDSRRSGIVCLSKLALLLQSLGAVITLSKLMRQTHKSYITKYPHLTFIQFCALLLRDDLKVKLRNKSMHRINKMRYERQQHIKNMQYIKDTPTEAQRQVIEIRKLLDELEAKQNGTESANTAVRDASTSVGSSERSLRGTHEIVIPISVFIQSWQRKQLIHELEQQSYLSGATIKRTKRYVAESTSQRLLRIPTGSRDEGLLSRRMLLNTLDSAIDRKYLHLHSDKGQRQQLQAFTFDNICDAETQKHKRRAQRRQLQKSYSSTSLCPKDFTLKTGRSFSKAVSKAMKQIKDSVEEDLPMHSLRKKAIMKHEITSCAILRPETLRSCLGSPSFEGLRKTYKKTPAERFVLKRTSTLPRLLLV